MNTIYLQQNILCPCSHCQYKCK